MHRSLPKNLMFIATIILSSLFTQDAWCQTTRTIKIVDPAGPGTSTDVLARVLAEQIGRAHGATIVVENRPGAGTLIGTEAVARAAHNGNTLLMVAPAFITIPHLRKLNYDPLTDFEPICSLATAPNVIVVNSASRYHTLAELLDAARARPGELTLASVGPGSAAHIGFEMLKRAAKVDITFVPYAGTAPAVNPLLGQHVTSYFGNFSVVAELLKAGTLRALGTATRTRIEALPDVPTVADSGYADYVLDFWIGVVAPARTPKETVAQLAGWFTAAIQVPDVKAKLAIQGLYLAVTCGADFAALLRRQYGDFGRVIRESNIKAE